MHLKLLFNARINISRMRMFKIISEKELPELVIIIGMANFRHRIEALREISQFLMKRKIVSKDYLRALIEREERYPTGLRISRDLAVALPHAHTRYTLKQALIVALLEHPIEFKCMGSPDKTVTVQAIIIVAVENLERSTKILRRLSDLLSKETFSRAIRMKDSDYLLKLLTSLCSEDCQLKHSSFLES